MCATEDGCKTTVHCLCDLTSCSHAVPKNLDAKETGTNHNPVDVREQRRLENGLSQKCGSIRAHMLMMFIS